MMFKRNFALLLMVSFVGFFQIVKAQSDTSQQINYSRKNSLKAQSQPYVMLVALDGMRWDLAEKYQAKNILALAKSGVQAEKLIPTYPTLTFPNHYSIVTGLQPAHHGIVDNNFYEYSGKRFYFKSSENGATDSTWYGGKPIWRLAEEQQMLSAVYFWPGSEHQKNGIRPSYYYKYNEVTPMPQRLGVIKEWLNLPAERRPHFIALYFPEIDKAAHRYSSDSDQTREAVLLMDHMIGQLQEIIKESGLPINLMVVSDHGMTTIDQNQTIPKPKALQNEDVVLPVGNTLLHVHVKDKSNVKSIYEQLLSEANGYQVYLRDKTPKKWYIRTKDDYFHRIGDIVLVPKAPKTFNINNRLPSLGQHGFPADHPDMAGIFYALGPQLKTNHRISSFENIHIYPLMAEILGLKITETIDGKRKVLKPILK